MRGLLIISVSAIVAVLGLMAGPAMVSAQDYPAREIRSICNLAPGSATDIFTRFFADKLSKLAGKPVVVENKVGAQGVIGVEAVARSKNDGYTIFIGSGSSAMAAAPNVWKKLPYDPVKDFEHVTTLAKIGFVMIVDAKRPINSVADLTALLKAKGDKANYGTSTFPGTVAGELYKAATGLPVLQVNYKSTAEILTDLVSGEIDYTFVSSATAMEHGRAGRVRPLAITPAQRMAVVPDWPTMIEAGVPGVDLLEWWSVHVPAGTPKPIVDRLEGWFNEIVRMEDTKKFLNNLGADPFPGSQAVVRQMLDQHTKAWARYVQLAKIEPQ